jgi:hypothetical protein
MVKPKPVTKKYRYSLKKLDHGSEKYGPCEICKKNVRGNMYLQSRKKAINYPDGAVTWVSDGEAFGHKACLMRKRK